MQSQLPSARRGPQPGDTAQEHRPSAVDHGDVLTEILHQIELMAGEQHRAPGSGPLAQGLGQAHHGHRVQTAERFVEDDDLGVMHQGGGQLEALLHAAGQLVGPVLPPAFES